MSHLQSLTLSTFAALNPDWEVRLFIPTESSRVPLFWPTPEQKIPYTGKDYTNELRSLDITISKVKLREDVNAIHRSDLLRWEILSTEGGLWSDMDILYLKPISSIKVFGPPNKRGHILEIDYPPGLDVYLAHSGTYHAIGFYLASPDNPFFARLHELAETSLLTPPRWRTYQSLGSELLNNNFNSLPEIANIFPELKWANLGMEIVYPYKYDEVDKLFGDVELSPNFCIECGNPVSLSENTIGVHWYNGSEEAKNFQNSGGDPNTPMGKLIEQALLILP